MTKIKISGISVLHEACTSGTLDTVLYLIQKGMDVNAKDAKGATAMHYAAGSARTEVVQILIEGGGELDCTHSCLFSFSHFSQFVEFGTDPKSEEVNKDQPQDMAILLRC